MWNPVPLNPNDPSRIPSSRCKHAAVVCDNHLYLLGGRNGNLPLRDFWKWSLDTNDWVLIPPLPNNPPALQEHTIIAYEHQLYVFGGEFASSIETPLWVFNVKKHSWRKWKGEKGCLSPSGRRGHSAVLHRNIMYIYGGYMDMRGSTGELWAFNLDDEVWQLLSPRRNVCEVLLPAARHTHSCVLFDKKLWIFGGMTDLQERNDFWTWDLDRGVWSCVRAKNGPLPLHSHVAIKYESSLYIIGGERHGQPTDEICRFQFATQTWFKIDLPPQRPQPRAHMACVVIPVAVPNSEITAITIPATPIVSVPRKTTNACGIQLDNEQRSRNHCKADLSPESTLKAPLATRVWPLRRTYSLLSNSSSDFTDLLEELECEENMVAKFGKSQTRDSGIDSVRSGRVDSTNTLSSPLPPESSVARPRSKTLFDLQSAKSASMTRSYTTVRFNPFANDKQVRLIDLEETEDLSSDESHHRGFAEALNPPLQKSPADVPVKDLVNFSSFASPNNKKLPVDQKHAEEKRFIILILGGREMGQITVFRRPLSVWKLRL